jgi:hypothetical protein
MQVNETQEAQVKAPEIFNQTAPEQDVSSAQEAVTTESVSQPQPIYLGGKKFSNIDELAAYTSQLEQEKVRAQYAGATYAQPAAQQQVEKPISELIFEDPEKALELHEQRVIQKLKAQEQAKQNETQLWNKFYSDNQDLADDKELVEFTLSKNWDSLKALHPDQAIVKLAELTRKTVSKYRPSNEKKQELQSGVARTGPTATQSAPVIQEKAVAPVDFVTQLKKIQKRRR